MSKLGDFFSTLPKAAMEVTKLGASTILSLVGAQGILNSPVKNNPSTASMDDVANASNQIAGLFGLKLVPTQKTTIDTIVMWIKTNWMMLIVLVGSVFLIFKFFKRRRK